MKTREQEELISQLKLEIREVTSAFKVMTNDYYLLVSITIV